jgi:hypothetical protein
MTEPELKKLLRGALGKEPDDAIWQSLVRRRHVSTALADSETDGRDLAVADLLDAYRDEEQIRAEARAPRRRDGEPKPRAITPDLSATALAVLMTKRAERLAYVQSFRREVLRGRLLKADKTQGWIRRQAKRDGDATWHTTKRPAVADWPAESESVPETLRYRSDGRTRVALIRIDGTLGRLKRVARELMRAFPTWTETDAVQFVLTGEMPLPLLANVTIRRHGHLPATDSIVIEVNPRVSPQEVVKLYQDARGGRSRSIGKAGKEGERTREHRLKLGLFADAHNDGQMTWPEVMAAWNAENPKQRYREPRLFANACRAGYQAITGTRLAWGRRGSEELSEAEQAERAQAFEEMFASGHAHFTGWPPTPADSPDDKTGE